MFGNHQCIFKLNASEVPQGSLLALSFVVQYINFLIHKNFPIKTFPIFPVCCSQAVVIACTEMKSHKFTGLNFK